MKWPLEVPLMWIEFVCFFSLPTIWWFKREKLGFKQMMNCTGNAGFNIQKVSIGGTNAIPTVTSLKFAVARIYVLTVSKALGILYPVVTGKLFCNDFP